MYRYLELLLGEMYEKLTLKIGVLSSLRVKGSNLLGSTNIDRYIQTE